MCVSSAIEAANTDRPKLRESALVDLTIDSPEEIPFRQLYACLGDKRQPCIDVTHADSDGVTDNLSVYLAERHKRLR